MSSGSRCTGGVRRRSPAQPRTQAPTAAALTPGAGPAIAAAGTPQTVPALRQWTAGSGSFTFGSTSRILVAPAYAARLDDDAATFADDLGRLAGRAVQVVDGPRRPARPWTTPEARPRSGRS